MLSMLTLMLSVTWSHAAVPSGLRRNMDFVPPQRRRSISFSRVQTVPYADQTFDPTFEEDYPGFLLLMSHIHWTRPTIRHVCGRTPQLCMYFETLLQILMVGVGVHFVAPQVSPGSVSSRTSRTGMGY
ncbi:hypothetical protein BDN71DRAFT_1445857 [Pleurotus eryngii]|uniref:Uncharacterized protein n=1 Tax=Pleurotus eryngii TaxID=5323 RepID=A0A9P6A2J6_PLEER|nr:hypothetical protein BDN71DRAFT_1445857 [Pleurotus eryngii]